MLLSSSRDKTVILWTLTREEGAYGYPKRSLRGHSHFVQDVVISGDGAFALSGSWDGTLRLWDLASGNTTRRFVGHAKDVLSVAFSVDNRQIVSGSRDKTIKLWNTLGGGTPSRSRRVTPSGCPACALPSPPTSSSSPVAGQAVKVWNLTNCKLRTNPSATPGTSTPSPCPPAALCASRR